GCDFGWPQNFCETFCNGDLLCPIDRIGNDASANRTARDLAPQFAPVCCVKHVESACSDTLVISSSLASARRSPPIPPPYAPSLACFLIPPGSWNLSCHCCPPGAATP